MKTLKRAVVGSFLALPLFAAGASTVSAQTKTEEPIIMMWCVSCETRHVIELAPN